MTYTPPMPEPELLAEPRPRTPAEIRVFRRKKARRIANYMIKTGVALEVAQRLTDAEWETIRCAAGTFIPSLATRTVVIDMLRSHYMEAGKGS